MAVITKERHIYDFVGGALCLDFVNSRSNYVDKLTPTKDYFEGYDDLLEWARQAGILSDSEHLNLNRVAGARPVQAEAALHKAKELRQAIQRTFLTASEHGSPEAQSFEHLNHEIAEAMSHARIEHSPDGYQWGWEREEGDLESILWPVAKSAADLLLSNRLARIHECAGDTCGWLFVDTSKNHSRRWCDMKDCGNVAKAKRHYHKTKAESK